MHIDMITCLFVACLLTFGGLWWMLLVDEEKGITPHARQDQPSRARAKHSRRN